MLERDIEKRVCEYAKNKGLLVYKFSSPSHRGCPDRLFIRPDGLVWFCEFKKEGQKPTPVQVREITRLRGHGAQVFVVDSVDEGKRVIDLMVGSC